MEVSEITLFNTLKGALGEEQAQIVVEGMKARVKEALENSKSVLATKEDVYALRNELKDGIAALNVKIEKTRADVIKWMFIFWAGQLAAIFGLLRVFFS